MIRLNSFVSVTLLTIISMPCLAQDWIEYVHKTDRFAVTFPSMPEIEETEIESAHGVPFPARIYSSQRGQTSFSLTVVDYTDAEERHRARPDQTDASSGANFWVMDIRASLAHTAQMIRLQTRAMGGEVTYEGWADIDKVEGHQMHLINADQSRTYIGIHLNNRRLYFLEATAPQNYPPVAWFQQSLQFINEEGMRIRYMFDADGQRINTRITPLAEALEGTMRVLAE
ncbi:MAG: hypothetical protein CMM56_07500 [Rhodospirillaceae bacterium]|nr:hypothetical protein [Rhodospirillaceae bacterium]